MSINSTLILFIAPIEQPGDKTDSEVPTKQTTSVKKSPRSKKVIDESMSAEE